MARHDRSLIIHDDPAPLSTAHAHPGLSYVSLLSDFAADIAAPELDADERMQIWDSLIQTLKEPQDL